MIFYCCFDHKTRKNTTFTRIITNLKVFSLSDWFLLLTIVLVTLTAALIVITRSKNNTKSFFDFSFDLWTIYVRQSVKGSSILYKIKHDNK